ncbi:MAG TPA: hypothetical protein ENN40_07160 [Candidatus Aminicenantes bacterium]|nr:hypothetical protein [Candidatus Aminicenantes bacterium]
MKTELDAHIGRVVVLDTDSNWVYIGRLKAIANNSICLADADVHHRHDSRTTTERYIMDTRSTGVHANRRTVYVNLRAIVSFSPLDEVIKY